MSTLYYFRSVCSSSCSQQYLNIIGPDVDISLFKYLQKEPFVFYKELDSSAAKFDYSEALLSINITKFNKDLEECYIYNNIGILYKGNYINGFYGLLRYINSLLTLQYMPNIKNMLEEIHIVPLNTQLQL